MSKKRTGTITRDVRAFAFGLMEGVGGTSYKYSEIATLLNNRFSVDIKPKTLRNWSSDRVNQKAKYGITDDYIQEIIAAGLAGKIETPLEVDEPPSSVIDIEEEPVEIIEDEDSTPSTPEEKLVFKSIAEVISYAEGQGFFVGKNKQDLIQLLESLNMTAIENADQMMGIEELFIEPLELDMEIVGRNVVTNPVIQFYYAIARKRHKAREPDGDLDINEWITACVVDVYNNMVPPIKLAVIVG